MRHKLFRIIDEDGDDNFIAADSYADAVAKFMAFIAAENGEPCEDTIQTVMFVGYLLKSEETPCQS